MNKVMLTGNLGRDPQQSVTAGGGPVTRFTLAVNRKIQTPDGEQWETDWYNVAAWGDPYAGICKHGSITNRLAEDGQLEW